jgi:tRNA nucleotidyltransferase/poly(A) polymerase
MGFNEFLLLKESFVESSVLVLIKNAIMKAGGEIYVVGGPVRDMLIGKEPKDIDFIVRKLPLDKIAQVTNVLGKAQEVGESFGIVKAVISGHEFDFAIPRVKEEKTGSGHTDFSVETDPNAKLEDDLGRRDFTWNAMAVPLSVFIDAQMAEDPSEFIREFLSANKEFDPYDGLNDLDDKKLKAVGDAESRFNEDPLRILRAIQFSTRMGFDIDNETAQIIKGMRDSIKTVSKERTFEEFKKAWLKGDGRANNENFVKNLYDLGIDKTLFGNDYDPYVVDLSRYSLCNSEIIEAMFISMFLNGGDYDSINPTNDVVEMLKAAREVLTQQEPPFNTVAKVKSLGKLNVIQIVLNEIDNGLGLKVQKMIHVPISGKDLTDIGITGHDLIAMGFKGKEIGDKQAELIKVAWDSEVPPTKELLLKQI